MNLVIHFNSRKTKPVIYKTAMSVIHKKDGFIVTWVDFDSKEEPELKKDTFKKGEIKWMMIH